MACAVPRNCARRQSKNPQLRLYSKYVEKNTRRYMVREFLRYNTPHVDDIFNVANSGKQAAFATTRRFFCTIITSRTHWRRCSIRNGTMHFSSRPRAFGFRQLPAGAVLAAQVSRARLGFEDVRRQRCSF
jgi:hypothetical protein